MSNFRLFFAVELAPDLKTRLLGYQDKIPDIVAKPVAGDNFHITLNFLGELNEKKLESILDNFAPLSISPFELELGDMIYWPKPKIIAAAVLDPEGQLLVCKKNIDDQLAQIGHFKREKRQYVPHITLFRQVDKTPQENLRFDAKLKVSQVSLMASRSARNGVIYDTVESWPLTHSSIKRQLLGE